MRRATVFVHGIRAGILEEQKPAGHFSFQYDSTYQGPPVSLTMPTNIREYVFTTFPPFFDGVLPEGVMLDALIRTAKIDRNDFFGQLLAVGGDLVGAVTVSELV